MAANPVGVLTELFLDLVPEEEATAPAEPVPVSEATAPEEAANDSEGDPEGETPAVLLGVVPATWEVAAA